MIRHPRLSVPSYDRLSLPAHRDWSRVSKFDINDAGYSELRGLFDYLRSEKLIGPTIAGRFGDNQVDHLAHRGTNNSVEICVVDAEDFVRKPDAIISGYCQSTGIPYDPDILHWENDHDQKRAAKIINRRGFDPYFHKAALESKTIQSSNQVGILLLRPAFDIGTFVLLYDRQSKM